MKYILIAYILGQNPATLGEYNSFEACNNAIRQTYMMKVPKEFWTNSDYLNALELNLKFQRDYVCTKK